jgi:hypothetical protein
MAPRGHGLGRPQATKGRNAFVKSIVAAEQKANVVVLVSSEFADQASDHDPSVARVKVRGGGSG